MPSTTISLRTQLKGALGDFLDEERMACVPTQEGLVSLVNALSLYREEGRALFPEVYVVDDLDTVLATLANSEHVEISTGNREPATIARALKQCAPLAQSGWAIYVHRQVNAFTYGLLRCGVHVLSARISDLLIEHGDPAILALMIRQVAENVVEVRGVGGSNLLVHFGATKTIEVSPVAALRTLTASIVTNVNERVREQTAAFFDTIIGKVLKASHGTLAVVQPYTRKGLPAALRDGIRLKEPISITEPIIELLGKNDCLANTRLMHTGEMISGMLLSDGITVFGSDGSVRAYNVFVKHKNAASAGRAGGARRRTYDTLRAMIGTHLDCVFMQSQDGHVDCEKREANGHD